MASTPVGVASVSGEPETLFVKKKPVNAAHLHDAKKDKSTSRPTPKPKATAAPASRPTKYLPTDRIMFSKQLDILRAWAAASGPLGKAVNNNDVARIVKMQASTVSLANAFFASIGLLIKSDSGYVPAAEVQAFLRNYEWSPDSAAQKLAPLISKTWFSSALLPKLDFGPQQEDECIKSLADEATAGPEYRNQLRVLLDYLTAVGLIQRDGTVIKKGVVNMNATTASVSNEISPPTPKQEAQAQDLAKAMPSLFGTTEGQVQFNIAVKVGMGEFANWQADRIAAFFGGIAQVLAAKAKVENGGE